jgi:DNA-binding NtrC family response regulator
VQALKIWSVHEKEISLLLTDMVMPNGITGRQLAAKIHEEKPQLPVVYASGYSVELTAPDFCESETELFLAKPYGGEQLVAAVRRLLGDGDTTSLPLDPPPLSDPPQPAPAPRSEENRQTLLFDL